MDEKIIVTPEFIKALCYHIIDTIDFYELMERTPNCNTCGKQANCAIVPAPGQQVRYNCAFYEAEEERDDE